MKKRKLFCEISPLTYKISTVKCQTIRILKDFFSIQSIAKTKLSEKLPTLVYTNNSLIRRKLGNVDLQLQDNKAINLNLTAPKITNIIIKPNEIFSFWNLCKNCTEKNGYKTGLTIVSGKPNHGVGGGICQFTNLIHWLVLHTPLKIIEHHHHDGVDLFPDCGRKIPFGTGTSVMYNYLDYRFKNTTNNIYQLIFYTTDEYLCGEIRTEKPLNVSYHIHIENEYFSKENNNVYRNGQVYRKIIDKITGETISDTLIKTNHAKVMYDTENLNITTVI